MTYDYGYGELGNELIDACRDYPPDFSRIKELLDLGIDLNMSSAEENDENMLSEIIKGYPDVRELQEIYCSQCEDEDCDACSLNFPDADGRYLPQIIKLFLDYGFDCSRNEGKEGEKCFINLTWSSYDRYILDAAKIFLQAGVNPEGNPYDDGSENLMEWVATKESAADCVGNNHEEANLFFTLYEIMDAYLNNEEYLNIDYFDKCIGKRIDRVMLCGGKESLSGVYDYSYNGKIYKNCFADNIVIWCEEMPLCINDKQDMYVDPRVPKKSKSNIIVDEHFADCIGVAITGFEFHIDNLFIEENKLNYIRPITLIHLNNGNTIRFAINYGEVPHDDTATYFEVLDMK